MPVSQQQRDTLLQTAKDANSFSQLTYLLHLVTAINSNDNLQSGFKYHRHGRGKGGDDDRGEDRDITLLDSIVAILVQEYEVVAACYTSDKVSVVVAAKTDPNSSTDFDELASDSEEPPDSPASYYPLQLAAVSNPDFNGNSPESESNLNANHNLQIQTTGKNLWTTVRDSWKWHCVFM
jgi:hypothetical protein